MKMTKTLLVGAVAALAMVVGFTGCGLDLQEWGHHRLGDKALLNYDNSTYDSGKGTWTVSGTNESAAEYLRGIDCLVTKHYDMSAVVSIDVGDSTPTDGNGVIGVVCDASKNDDGTWNFMNIGVRYTKSNGLQYYVSYFGNIAESDINKYNMGAYYVKKGSTITCYDPDTKTKTTTTVSSIPDGSAYEVELKAFTDLSGVSVESGAISVAIDAKQITNETDVNVGGYTVSFYKVSDVYKSSYSDLDTSNATALTNSTVTVNNSDIGKTAAAQKWCGAYANVYGECTLSGDLQIVGLTKESEEE